MKTKLLLFFFLTVFFSEPVFSQDYFPFLNNSSWVVRDWVACCRPPRTKVIHEGNDVAVGENAYKKFCDPFHLNGVDTLYVRENVEDRKVYRLIEEEEVLIYDFSLEDGDEFYQNGIAFSAAVDEIAVNNGMRKRISLTSIQTYNGFYFTQVWIEGVGTIAHPFYPDSNMYNVLSTGGGTTYTTRCGFQGFDHVYGTPSDCESYLANPEIDTPTKNIVLSPNPFVTELMVTSETDFVNATFRLYTLQGQLVKEMKNLNGKSFTVQRESLSSGLYLSQLIEGNQTSTDKVIVH